MSGDSLRRPSDVFFANFPGGDVRFRQWRPDGKPIGGVVLLHGMGDHTGRYYELMRLFADRGFHCIGFDWPGHGGKCGATWAMWEPSRPFGRWSTWRGRALKREIGGGLPCGIVGHSAGGFVALRYLAEYPSAFQFGLLSSPLVDPASRKPAWLPPLVRLLNRLAPHLTSTRV